MLGIDQLLIAPIDFHAHPMRRAKEKTQIEYLTHLFAIIHHLTQRPIDKKSKALSDTIYPQPLCALSGALTMITTKLSGTLTSITKKKCIAIRLDEYKKAFHYSNTPAFNRTCSVKDAVRYFSFPGRKKQLCCMICDVALLFMDSASIQMVVSLLDQSLSRRKIAVVNDVVGLLLNKKDMGEAYQDLAPLIKCYWDNDAFLRQTERRIIVTANISAGKSTLINAIVGKPITKTSQGVCTGNATYILSKSHEDRCFSLAGKDLILKATLDQLRDTDWEYPQTMSAWFCTADQSSPKRVRIIDTPGVNASQHREHTQIARDEITKQRFDVAIYVVNPTNLGTDAELRHIRWTYNHVPQDKTVFVLNKLDKYSTDNSDSVEESIHGLRKDLQSIGYENPVICPVSAYFALLLKMKLSGQALSEDEEDEYKLLSKKFNRKQYDLSDYYQDCEILDCDSQEVALSKKCGIYGIEKIVYGGLA